MCCYLIDSGRGERDAKLKKGAISEGVVYPLLRRLTSEGYFTTYLKESAEKPPRKYYAITEQGKAQLDELRAGDSMGKIDEVMSAG
ncbi:PadR family transcriptional regulator [Exiguobacterium sp. SH3S1]|uniref:PadR family transcriptional regulator n=1 Tax=Exiguobacterium sp. SH3S1 TaxID=2510955 RepID=UPI001F48AB2A|nr:PadR family transcriptional regulator [Exiguobacterium sp. SH3S1]